MKRSVQLTLGIMTALGGFVDLGQIVFAMQAGAVFGYTLIWAIVLGAIALIIYTEMCGRVAAQQPVFAVVRAKLGSRLGIATLVGSNVLNVLTCAAALGAVAIVLHLFFGINERVALVGGAVGLGLVVWRLRVQRIERTFGLAGLTMIVFAVAAWTLHPDWGAAAAGLIPRLPGHGSKDVLLAAYFAVGIFSALLMAYEVHFLPEKRIVATTGILLGSLLTGALLVLAALVFFPRGIFPDLLSTTALPVALPLGSLGLRVALVGILACVAGAAVETAMSAGYNVCQFYGLESNKDVPPEEVPVFTGTWVATLAIALFVALTGIKPLTLVSFAIMFGMVLMPLRYYPILKAAGDRELLGWLCFGIIVIAALAAVPLLILTHGGRP